MNVVSNSRSGLWRLSILAAALVVVTGGVPVAAGVASAANHAAILEMPACTIVGTSAADVLVGTSSDDVMCGLGGDDILEGLGGSDVLIGGPGNDLLAGNFGNDQLFGHGGDDTLYGGPGSDLLAGGGGRDQMRGGHGDDELHGGDGVDRLIGGEGNDELWGGSGPDTLEGRAGHDTLKGGPGNDELAGNADDDLMFGQAGQDILIGGPGFDELAGGGDADVLRGGADDDRLLGEDGADTLAGGAGNDSMWGGPGADLIEGLSGNDKLWGGADDDVLAGNHGADTLIGAGGDDKLFGGPDSDECDGGPGSNTLVGCEVVAWDQIGGDIDGAEAKELFGRRVAMSAEGDMVVIGATSSFFDSGRAGLARVYRFDGSAWTQVGGDIDGEAVEDASGQSVAMSDDGKTVIVGAPYNDGNGGSSGHARVYRLDGSVWTQIGGDIDGEGSNNYSGWSVAMSSDGGTVIIGSPHNSDTDHAAGQVRIYRLDGLAWTQVGGDIEGDAIYDQFGTSVAMSSDGATVIVGTPYSDANGIDAGQVSVYHFNGSAWTQVGGDIDGEAARDEFGYSVAMSSDGGTIVVGAPLNDGGGGSAGHARVYRFDGSAWIQIGDDIEGEASFDVAGRSVAMSSDGHTVAVGAPYNDGNGIDAGHARVYSVDGATWTQVGADMDGEAAFDELGQSVAMNSDGGTVIVGAPFNDANGPWAGHARVYTFD